MSDIGFAHPDLFDPIVTPTDSVPWTELVWENGRTYRYRVHEERMGEEAYEDRAPGSYWFELEVGSEGVWKPVRYHVRRDEIWNHVRQSLEERNG